MHLAIIHVNPVVGSLASTERCASPYAPHPVRLSAALTSLVSSVLDVIDAFLTGNNHYIAKGYH
eukprot:5022852-Pyramimonas_sp.AAC.1